MSTNISPDNDGFKSYVLILSLFAIGHFNFSFDPDVYFDLENIDTKCSFLDWKLSVKRIKHEVADTLIFKAKKDTEYSSCIIFAEKESISTTMLNSLKADLPSDEYLFCNSTNYGEKNSLYLSIFDIDSFCRIQQLLLRSMIYSDKERTHCPFCGSKLYSTPNGHECLICRAEIIPQECPETAKPYIVSDIKRYRTSKQKAEIERRNFLHDRLDEAQLYYRNITPINRDGKPLCPHCGKLHK